MNGTGVTVVDGLVSIRWRADGIPKPQPRTQAFARKTKTGGAVARVFTPGTAEAWKGEVVLAGRFLRPKTPIDDVPIAVEIDLEVPRPKRLCRKKDDPGPLPATTLGDVDNYAKAVLDALTHDGWWTDDKLVTDLHVRKSFHAIGDRPGAWVCLSFPIEGAEVTIP